MSTGRGIWNDFKMHIQHGGPITWFIVVNVLIFVLLNSIMLVGMIVMGSRGEAYTIVSDVLDWIGLNWHWRVFLVRPWTFLTSIFTQYDFLHLFFNMVLFYWLAHIVKDFIGERHVMPIFFYGAFAGSFLYIIIKSLINLIGPGIEPNVAIGSSGGVMAIIVAAATLVPDLPIRVLLIGFVRLKYFAIVLVLLDVLMLHDGNAGGHLAHLGGALFGFIYIRQLKVGTDWSLPFSRFVDLLKKPFVKNLKPKGPRMVYKREEASPTVAARKKQEHEQEKIDAILDKINQSGYDSLTKEEKGFLFRYSNKD